MKRYIKSSINIEQNLNTLNSDQLQKFVESLSIGSIIQYTADYGDWEHPQFPTQPLICIHRKMNADDWLTKYGNTKDNLSSNEDTDSSLTFTLKYDYMDYRGEDPRYNGKIMVTSEGKSYTTYLQDYIGLS